MSLRRTLLSVIAVCGPPRNRAQRRATRPAGGPLPGTELTAALSAGCWPNPATATRRSTRWRNSCRSARWTDLGFGQREVEWAIEGCREPVVPSAILEGNVHLEGSGTALPWAAVERCVIWCYRRYLGTVSASKRAALPGRTGRCFDCSSSPFRNSPPLFRVAARSCAVSLREHRGRQPCFAAVRRAVAAPVGDGTGPLVPASTTLYAGTNGRTAPRVRCRINLRAEKHFHHRLRRREHLRRRTTIPTSYR